MRTPGKSIRVRWTLFLEMAQAYPGQQAFPQGDSSTVIFVLKLSVHRENDSNINYIRSTNLINILINKIAITYT